MRRRTLLLVLPSCATQGRAQGAYPARAVRIAPQAPGGGVDLVARILADRLGKRFGQAFVIDNQAGAGGSIAAQAAARAAPDGYTLMIGYVATHATNPAVRKVPYDALRDFTPIAMIGGTPNLLVCRPSLPVGTLAEFVAYARAQPDKVNYGTSGKGTLNHLVMEQFKNAAGGIVGPARLPGAIVRQLNDEINRMLAQPDFRDRLSAEALDPMPMTPPQFGEYIAAEIRHWTAVAQANRITGD